MKQQIKNIPLLGPVASRLYRKIKGQDQPFPGSAEYWQQRYTSGGTSGAGSYGQLAEFKAEILNDFVRSHNVRSVIEFGSGDGNQLRLAEYPQYLGIDVSEQAVVMCRQLFVDDPTKRFQTLDEYGGEGADLALSLDVIYHLVEDAIYQRYMETLFEAGDRFVIIYSSNMEDEHQQEGAHVRHRKFTDWVQQHAQAFELMHHIPNKYTYQGDTTKGSFADFWVFQRQSART